MHDSRLVEPKPIDTAGDGVGGPTCRRLHRRMVWGKSVALAWLRSDGSIGPWTRVTATDVSLGGMALSGMIEFRPGAVGVVELPSSDGGRALVGVQVVHIERLSPTSESAGVKYVPLARQIVESTLVHSVDPADMTR